ncbi:ATP/GTP-binding protein [Streptomyces kunmingensis]|uniref:ATP/GTP-binding protein n=1 Tax=Streptomyces kunmingensis TaxID=68225 RepID=A0ABU6C4G8_9ACTN|nr:ATP/GTP-binding protein [Streptomyces kunmingensis]MEB3959559.1 ATP/GTP-binding protein [Streptomyces kunmingensis]
MVLGSTGTASASPPMGGQCGQIDRFVSCDASGDARTEGQPGTSGPRHSSAKGKQGGKPSKCKLKKVEPPPPPDTIGYQGEGMVAYERVCGNAVTHVGVPEGDAVPAVDPAVVAARAVDKMELLGPKVASPRAGAKYTVGVPLWMWVTPSATTFGPNTATASAGGVAVTAKAAVSKIVWHMGDGETVTCKGPGTPFKNTRNGIESPDCGHIYQQPSTQEPGTKYRLTATAYWDVTWQASTGEEGQIPTTRQTAVSFTVGELQSVGS